MQVRSDVDANSASFELETNTRGEVCVHTVGKAASETDDSWLASTPHTL